MAAAHAIRGKHSAQNMPLPTQGAPFPVVPSAVCGAGMLACALFPHAVPSGVISLIFFAAFVLWTARSRVSFYAKYLPFTFAVLANIAGCAVIEYFPTYLYEIRSTTFFSGCLPLLVFSRWLFFAGLFAFDAKWGVELKGFEKFGEGIRNNRWLFALSLLTLAISIIMFAYVAPNPSFATGVDRFTYAKTLPHFMARFAMLMTYMILISLLAIRWGDKRIGIATVVLYVLYMFWTGVKFGGFFTLICLVVLVFYDKIYALGVKSSGRIMVLIVLAFALLLGLAVFAHSLTSSRTPVEFVSGRLGQQGQLWWGTFSKFEGDPHPEEFINEIEALGRGSSAAENVGSQNGIYKIMYLNAPEDVVNNKLEAGSRYTEAGYAAMFYYFGPFGPVIFSLVFALLLGFLANVVLKMFITGELISSVIVFRLFMVGQTSLSQFTFHDFVDKMSVLSYAVLVVLLLIPALIPKCGELKRKLQMKSEPGGSA